MINSAYIKAKKPRHDYNYTTLYIIRELSKRASGKHSKSAWWHNTKDVAAILETGISGIAVSTAIAVDFNSIKTFNELLSASSTADQRHTFE